MAPAPSHAAPADQIKVELQFAAPVARLPLTRMAILAVPHG